MRKTINSDIVLKYPIHPHYQKVFLKRIIDLLEKNGQEICDDLYNAYGRLVAMTVDEADYFKHYSLENSDRVISLRESVNLVCDGTTGLRTWQVRRMIFILSYSFMPLPPYTYGVYTFHILKYDSKR